MRVFGLASSFFGVAMIAICSYGDVARPEVEPNLDLSVVWGGQSSGGHCFGLDTFDYICAISNRNGCGKVACSGPGPCPSSTKDVKASNGWRDNCKSVQVGQMFCKSGTIYCKIVQTCGSCVRNAYGAYYCSVAASSPAQPQTDHVPGGLSCP
ncbi:MAG: hypothetical protein KatS3mg111_0764 [Pirellulaceae bacterium]|nr:MAG: hypothetical protein KatS3mg111_0764 [Pirellulaceae bacterium]